MKRRISLSVLSIGLLFLGSFLFSSTALACSCIAPEPPVESLEKADYVFRGEVTEVNQTSETIVDFNVNSVYKANYGGLSDKTTIRTQNDSAACGVNFEKGEEYIVYANRQDALIYTNLCTRTSLISNAEEDIVALDDYVYQQDFEENKDEDNNTAIIVIGVTATILVIGASVYFIYKSKK